MSGPRTVGRRSRVVERRPTSKANEAAETFANPSGNPVLHGTNTYAIYWDPTDHYHGDWQNLIDDLLPRRRAPPAARSTSVFAVDSQYTDKTNQPASYKQVFKGAYTDTTPTPPSAAKTRTRSALVDRIGPEIEEEIVGEKVKVDTRLPDRRAGGAAARSASSPPTGCRRGSATSTTCSRPPGVTVCLDAGGADRPLLGLRKRTETKATRQQLLQLPRRHQPRRPPHRRRQHDRLRRDPLDRRRLRRRRTSTGADQTPGWECQDGGYRPRQQTDREKREKAKEENAEEKEEFEKKDVTEKAEALRSSDWKAPPAGAQPGALPDHRRRLRPRPRRPDHQPDRHRAAEHRHQPAAERLAGHRRQREHRRVPLLLRARRSAAPSQANPETGAGTLFNQTSRDRQLLPQRRLQPRRHAAGLPGRGVHQPCEPRTEVHRAQPGQLGRNRRLRRHGVRTSP